MQIISTIYKNEELNNLIDYADGFILMVKPFAICYGDINLDLAIDILRKNKKKIILGLNKIYHPSDIESLSDLLDKYQGDDIYYYFSDLGACNLAINKGLNNKVIYNPETMITNYLDLSILQSFNFDAYQLSSEITLNDCNLVYQKTNAPISYYGFGHKIMFYSKRKLISLYKTKTGIDMPLEKGYLKESTRDDFIPVTENQNGTYILRSYVISLLNDIDKLEFLKYLILDSNYVDFLKYQDVLKAYYLYNSKKITLDEANSIINNLNLDIQDGFKINDTVYLKEELKNV